MCDHSTRYTHSTLYSAYITQLTRIHLTYVALHEVIWCMVVWCTQKLCQDDCSFMRHQPCQRCKYTTSVDIQKTRYKKLVIHVEPHASAVSLLKREENSAIQATSINQSIKKWTLKQ